MGITNFWNYIKDRLSTFANIVTLLTFSVFLASYFSGWIKMLLSFLTISIDIFWLIMAIIALVLIIININKISPLGRKCAKLLTLAKLPITLDKAITVEIDPKWHNPVMSHKP